MELRDSGGDGRTLTGIAVPYGTISLLGPHPDGERFAVGAFRRSLDHRKGRLPKLFRNHRHDVAVGTATDMRDTPEGLLATWRIADTPEGNAALLEVREGVLDSLSVGFRVIREARVDGVREIREAQLAEVSLVPLPAYPDARVLSVRSGADIVVPPMPDIDLAPLMIAGRAW